MPGLTRLPTDMTRLPSGLETKVAPSDRKRSRFLPLLGAAVAALAPGLVNCYATGAGTDPPLDRFYFPVGLAVSHGGNVLYALNSDFDLQYNGGTIQSYDLAKIRRDAVLMMHRPYHPSLPLERPLERVFGVENKSCDELNLPQTRLDDTARPFGSSCAPAVLASAYVKDAAIIGAFGTDLQISRDRRTLQPPEGTLTSLPRTKDRLFAPLRGSASIFWVDVANDSNAAGDFAIDCGVRVNNRCEAKHFTGTDPDAEPANTRKLTLPGEPFGLAQSEDGASLVVTHQNDTKASLLSTGLTYDCGNVPGSPCQTPSVQFIAEGLRTGGTSVVAVPYDRDAFFDANEVPKPAYLGTSRLVAELGLLREYPDEAGGTASSLRRPFLARERAYPLTISAGGTDSRGIVLDPTPRLVCKARVRSENLAAVPPRTAADVAKDRRACARKPLRVFVANRTPAALLVGELGTDVGRETDETFDPERLTFFDSIPLTAGPSKVFLAPIVDAKGNYALRVFVVCFDASAIYVLDPDTLELENTIRVEAGPFALAFDPFLLEDVALRKPVPTDATVPLLREPGTLHKYRFAYVASFTKSTVQLLDLDNSLTKKDTFERVVFNVGEATLPKGVK
jgi:hypothetical protein